MKVKIKKLRCKDCGGLFGTHDELKHNEFERLMEKMGIEL